MLHNLETLTGSSVIATDGEMWLLQSRRWSSQIG